MLVLVSIGFVFILETDIVLYRGVGRIYCFVANLLFVKKIKIVNHFCLFIFRCFVVI